MMYKKRGKKKYILIALIALLTIAATTIFLAQTNEEDKAYRTISVVEVSGKVSAVKDGIEYKAYPGMLLQEGHEIVTAGNSYVRLVLDGDKYVKLEAGSKLVFKTLGFLGSGKTGLSLERGALTTELVNPLGEDDEFIVHTPNAVLAVRGTFFRVDLGVAENGDIKADVMTYGGQVASQRVMPSGEVVEEEVLIDAGFKTTINMTKDDTHYVVETEDGDTVIVDPVLPEEPDEEEEILRPAVPITTADISDEDLIDVYFSIENGHDLFVTKEEVEADLEVRELDIEGEISVYEKAKEIILEQEVEEDADIATTSASVVANDSKPIAMKPESSGDKPSGGNNAGASSGNSNSDSVSTLVTDGEIHKHQKVTYTEAATCVADGKTVTKCEECNKVLSKTEHLALGHDFEAHLTVDKAATCTEDGSTSRHCSRCEEKTDVTIQVATGHKYSDWKVAQVATCEADGHENRTCSNCNNLETKTIAKLEHEKVVVRKDPTAQADGEKSVCCKNCSYVFESEVLFSIPLYFPDAVFAQYVEDTFDADADGALSTAEVETLKETTVVNVSGTSSSYGAVTSLVGIEHFDALTTLNCEECRDLTGLNLTANKELTSLKIAQCDSLETLNLEGCAKLTELNVGATNALVTVNIKDTGIKKLYLNGHPNLVSLDSTNAPLEELDFVCEKLENIDLSTNTELKLLSFQFCTKLDEIPGLNNCNKLQEFRLSDSAVKTVTLREKEDLTFVSIYNCDEVTKVDVTNSSAIETMSAGNAPKLTEVYLAGCTSIESLDLAASAIEELTIRDLTNMETLNLYGCEQLLSVMLNEGSSYNSYSLTSINVTGCTRLTDLYLANCYDLETIDTSYLSNLANLVLNNSKISDLNISTNSSLRVLSLENMPISTLDFSTGSFGFYGLSALNIKGTNITELDVTYCQAISTITLNNDIEVFHARGALNLGTGLITWGDGMKLREVDLNGSSVKSINTSTMYNLETLNLQNTMVTSLNLVANGNLKTLNVNGTPITSLSLAQNGSIESVDVGYCNDLKVLSINGDSFYDTMPLNTLNLTNVTGLTNLTLKNCTNLTNLDFSANTGITYLDISGVPISTLDLAPYTELEYAYLGNTPLTTLELFNHTKLAGLYLGGSDLTSVDLTGCSALSNFQVNEGIESLCLRSCPSLQVLDLSMCTNLKTLDIGATSITSLNSSMNGVIAPNTSQLTSLSISDSSVQITADDDLTWLSNVKVFYANNVPMRADAWANLAPVLSNATTIGLSGINPTGDGEYMNGPFTGSFPNLQELSLEGSYLITSVDVSAYPELQVLVLNNLGITSLDLANNTKLTNLSVRNTYIETLENIDVCASTLEGIDCSYTRIQELNLSAGFTELTHVEASHCEQPFGLNLNNCTKVSFLDVTGSDNITSAQVSYLGSQRENLDQKVQVRVSTGVYTTAVFIGWDDTSMEWIEN